MPHALQELGLFFLFLCFSPSLSVYKAIEGDAVLEPTSTAPSIQSIVWKHNKDIAAEWSSGDKFRCLGQFEGRCEVNTDSGALTIKGLKLNDSGIYTPEINGRDLDQIELSVISRVAKPSVKTTCNAEKTRCRLTCEGITANAKPAIIKWFVDGRDVPSQDSYIIEKDTKGGRFRCMMRNPVSNETSESITNPFIKPIYGAKGEDMILRPPPMTETIQSINWKHNEDIMADWHGNNSKCRGQFEGRCEVNTDTGALTIKRLNLNDNGIYTPEINGKDLDKIKVSVISRVAKPSVKSSCNTEMTSCDLTCEGNTAEAEPITYKWFIDGKDGPLDKVLSITKDSKEYSFRCLMMNPVSSETSESITNPIIMKQKKEEQDRQKSILGAVVAAVVIVFLIIVVAAFFIYKRREMLRRELDNTVALLRKIDDSEKKVAKLDEALRRELDEVLLRDFKEVLLRQGQDTVNRLRKLYVKLPGEVDDIKKWLNKHGGTEKEMEPLSPPPDANETDKLLDKLDDTVKRLREVDDKMKKDKLLDKLDDTVKRLRELNAVDLGINEAIL